MRKLPQTGVRGRPLSSAQRFRGWLATWLQDRRRKRQQPAPALIPNAPDIVGGDPQWEATTPGWWDVYIDWVFDHGNFPQADMEVWLSINNGPFYHHYTVPSGDPGYYYENAADSETTFDFKVRYTNGTTVGPFSNVYRIDIQV